MEIEIFTLCDFAQDNSGKLTVVGTFDGIYSKQFPFVQANFSVACRLRFSEKEAGAHDMRLRFTDGDKQEFIKPIEGQINIAKPQNGQYSAVNLVSVSYTHLRAHETPEHLVCRLLLEK